MVDDRAKLSGCDCEQCGYCTFGCRVGGSNRPWRRIFTYATMARSTVMTGCRAEQILFERGRGFRVAATRCPGRRPRTCDHPRRSSWCAPAGSRRGTTSAIGLSHSRARTKSVSASHDRCRRRLRRPDPVVAGATTTILSGHFAASTGTSAFASRRRRSPGAVGACRPMDGCTISSSHDATERERRRRDCAHARRRGWAGARRRAGGVTIDYTLGRGAVIGSRGVPQPPARSGGGRADEVHTFHASVPCSESARIGGDPRFLRTHYGRAGGGKPMRGVQRSPDGNLSHGTRPEDIGLRREWCGIRCEGTLCRGPKRVPGV